MIEQSLAANPVEDSDFAEILWTEGERYRRILGESPQNLLYMRLLDEQYTKTPFYGVPKLTVASFPRIIRNARLMHFSQAQNLLWANRQKRSLFCITRPNPILALVECALSAESTLSENLNTQSNIFGALA